MEAAISDQKDGEKGVHPDSLRDMAACLGFSAPEPGKPTHISQRILSSCSLKSNPWEESHPSHWGKLIRVLN